MMDKTTYLKELHEQQIFEKDMNIRRISNVHITTVPEHWAWIRKWQMFPRPCPTHAHTSNELVRMGMHGVYKILGKPRWRRRHGKWSEIGGRPNEILRKGR